jgi:dTDP-4-dehydrorhamnose reductase
MRVLLLGAGGQVGWELQRALAPLAAITLATRQGDAGTSVDLERPEQMRDTLRRLQPEVIVNAAAFTAVDTAETDRERARTVNATSPGVLGEEAARLGALLVHYSTDYVFDGSGSAPWREDDAAAPLNVYGETKLAGEVLVRGSGCSHLIFRTSWVYATRGRNFLRTMLRLSAERETLSVVNDQHGAPTGAELIADVTAHAITALQANARLGGTYHLVAGGTTTWFDYASFIIGTASGLGHPLRLRQSALAPCSSRDFPSPARRPHNSRLSTAKLRSAFGLELPDWRSGVDRAIREICTT